jgi:hypothetical protein
VTVGADAVLQFSTGGAVKGLNTTTRTLHLLPGSTWGYAGNATEELEHRVINNGGKFIVGLAEANLGEVHVKLTGGDANNPSYAQNRLSIFVPAPELTIVNGSLLEVTNGVTINDGNLTLAGNSHVVGQVARLKGNLEVNGGLIGFLNSPLEIDETLTWGVFRVEGDARWTGGVYNPGVDARPNGDTRCNLWEITGRLTINQSSAPTIHPVPQGVPQGGSTPQRIWKVIDAGDVQGDNPNIPQGWLLLPIIDPQGVKKGFKVEYTG